MEASQGLVEASQGLVEASQGIIYTGGGGLVVLNPISESLA